MRIAAIDRHVLWEWKVHHSERAATQADSRAREQFALFCSPQVDIEA
jgi:hypothetical protein